MVVKALLPELLKLREAGVSSASFDEHGNLTGITFFAEAPAAPAPELEREEKTTQEPDVPSGYLNAAKAFEPRKKAGAA
jgi:hypothetical protein